MRYMDLEVLMAEGQPNKVVTGLMTFAGRLGQARPPRPLGRSGL